MPEGKPAGVVCVQLTDDHRCGLFGSPERPAVCIAFRPTREICGATRDQAYLVLEQLEHETTPATSNYTSSD